MELDLNRWHSLQQEIIVLAAQHRGIGQTVFELELQRSRAEANRLRAHQEYTRREGGKREIAAAAEEAFAEATQIVAGYDDQLSALQRQLGVLSQRASALQALARACRNWARANNVPLPDADETRITGMPQATRGKEFWENPPVLRAQPPPPVAAPAAQTHASPDWLRRILQ